METEKLDIYVVKMSPWPDKLPNGTVLEKVGRRGKFRVKGSKYKKTFKLRPLEVEKISE